MPVYLWEGTTKKGEKKKGELEAADESSVRIQLRRQRLKAESIKKKPTDLFETIPFPQEKV
ncbi:MAG: type II secretion system F family protein, partial [Deltaproteobacteria bacterium]|nr:type II secretion system F family protein [Deltaproteobacteria bacterium]